MAWSFSTVHEFPRYDTRVVNERRAWRPGPSADISVNQHGNSRFLCLGKKKNKMSIKQRQTNRFNKKKDDVVYKKCFSSKNTKNMFLVKIRKSYLYCIFIWIKRTLKEKIVKYSELQKLCWFKKTKWDPSNTGQILGLKLTFVLVLIRIRPYPYFLGPSDSEPDSISHPDPKHCPRASGSKTFS